MYKVEKRKGPTYITENYTQLFVITYKGKESVKTETCRAVFWTLKA